MAGTWYMDLPWQQYGSWCGPHIHVPYWHLPRPQSRARRMSAEGPKPLSSSEELIAKGICPVKPEFVRNVIGKITQDAVTGSGMGAESKSKKSLKKVCATSVAAHFWHGPMGMCHVWRTAKSLPVTLCACPHGMLNGRRKEALPVTAVEGAKMKLKLSSREGQQHGVQDSSCHLSVLLGTEGGQEGRSVQQLGTWEVPLGGKVSLQPRRRGVS